MLTSNPRFQLVLIFLVVWCGVVWGDEGARAQQLEKAINFTTGENNRLAPVIKDLEDQRNKAEAELRNVNDALAKIRPGSHEEGLMRGQKQLLEKELNGDPSAKENTPEREGLRKRLAKDEAQFVENAQSIRENTASLEKLQQNKQARPDKGSSSASETPPESSRSTSDVKTNTNDPFQFGTSKPVPDGFKADGGNLGGATTYAKGSGERIAVDPKGNSWKQLSDGSWQSTPLEKLHGSQTTSSGNTPAVDRAVTLENGQQVPVYKWANGTEAFYNGKEWVSRNGNSGDFSPSKAPGEFNRTTGRLTANQAEPVASSISPKGKLVTVEPSGTGKITGTTTAREVAQIISKNPNAPLPEVAVVRPANPKLPVYEAPGFFEPQALPSRGQPLPIPKGQTSSSNIPFSDLGARLAPSTKTQTPAAKKSWWWPF